MSAPDMLLRLREFLPTVKSREPLAKYTTFKVGGPAKYFVSVMTTEEMITAIKTARHLRLPFFILGGGSNVLVSDRGFDGLVIRAENKHAEFLPAGLVKAGAGMNLAALAILATQKGLGGLEFGVGIPGTVGGAVRGNAGCFGQEIKDVIQSVSVIDEEGDFHGLKNLSCRFKYRDSRFKHEPSYILEVIFSLRSGEGRMDLIDDYRRRKDATQDFQNASAGCIFKNPSDDQYAGQLIDQLELKGFKLGGAMVSLKHGNFILNTGRATADDIATLISLIKEKVRRHYGVQLQEEIQYVGF